METKNRIISEYILAIMSMTGNLSQFAGSLGDNYDENSAIIRTLSNQLDCLKSQIVILQQALDSYSV